MLGRPVMRIYRQYGSCSSQTSARCEPDGGFPLPRTDLDDGATVLGLTRGLEECPAFIFSQPAFDRAHYARDVVRSHRPDTRIHSAASVIDWEMKSGWLRRDS